MPGMSKSSGADPLLENLTEAQREAVQHVDGPLLVLAGAGSGKTRVITRRIAHLVMRAGVAPWHIVAITFTNKAAGEMRQRVASFFSERQARAVTVSTFHSLCARILRRHAQFLDLPPGFSIYDTNDQQRAMKQVLEQLEVNSTNFPPAKVLGTISNAKNELVDAEAYAQTAGDYYSRTVAKLFRKYQQVLKQNHAVDFDDLILLTVKLMRTQPAAMEELRDRYRYILIDEYQDTNHAQFVLASALAASRRNICATGDPDQSIYGWRGADIRNILEFETHYPDTKIVRLEQNYRSTKSILAAADGLIRHNRQRKHKELWTENQAGDSIRVTQCQSEREEAAWVVEWFRQVHEQEGVPWSGFAVFYRTNSLSRVIEDAFRAAAIPYQIARGTAFYERKEVKDAVAYLRVIANPEDEVNLLRIINTPARGISATTVKALQAFAVARQTTVREALRRADEITSLNKRAVDCVSRFSAQLAAWRQQTAMDGGAAPTGNNVLKDFVERVLRDSGLEEYYRNDKQDADGDRIENLGELVSSAQQYESDLAGEVDLATQVERQPGLDAKLLGYLEQISLVSDVDSIAPEQGAVTLMTLHAAKGLEFPVVAMVGVEDGLLPHQRSLEGDSIEEERRLCFVGITRAMRLLAMTHTRFRTIFGTSTPTIPSRFLRELPSKQVEQVKATSDESTLLLDGDPVRSEERRRLLRHHEMTYPPGQLVHHAQFGFGRILKVASMGEHTRAQIEFERAGVKTLVLEYARLEPVTE